MTSRRKAKFDKARTIIEETQKLMGKVSYDIIKKELKRNDIKKVDLKFTERILNTIKYIDEIEQVERDTEKVFNLTLFNSNKIFIYEEIDTDEYFKSIKLKLYSKKQVERLFELIPEEEIVNFLKDVNNINEEELEKTND